MQYNSLFTESISHMKMKNFIQALYYQNCNDYIIFRLARLLNFLARAIQNISNVWRVTTRFVHRLSSTSINLSSSPYSRKIRRILNFSRLLSSYLQKKLKSFCFFQNFNFKGFLYPEINHYEC